MITHWRKLAVALIGVFLLVLLLDAYPGLRGGAGWQWTYALPESWLGAVCLAVVLAVYGAGAWWMLARAVRIRWTLVWAFMGAVAVTFAVVGVRGDAGFLLFTRTVSPVQTGASALAVHVMAADGVDTTLARWTDVMQEAYALNLIHFTTSPPGQALVHYHLAEGFDAPLFAGVSHPISRILRTYQCSDLQVMAYTQGEIVSAGFMAFLMPFFAALAVFPLAMAAYDLTGNDAATVRRVVVWWALIPTIALFAPTWNTLYPALAILTFALLIRGLLRQQMRFMLAAGAVMSAATFLNFALLPLLLPFGLVTLGYALLILPQVTRVQALVWAVKAGVWFGAGLASVWLIFALTTGVSPLDLVRLMLTSHRDIVQREASDYFAWLLLHPYDVALFVGLPVMLLALVGMWTAARAVWSGGRTLWQLVALSMALTVLIVDVMGIVQGENGRILSFYAPFLLLVGAGMPSSMATGDQPTGQPARFAPFMGLQVLSVWVMAVALVTVPLDLNPPVIQPRDDMGTVGESLPFIMSPDATFTSTQYTGALALNGYRYIADPAAQAISYEWAWEGITPTDRPYQFELIARAHNELDGDIIAEPFRWYAQNGHYLPTCWQAGDAVRDVVVLPLPPVSMPVIWEVELRAVDLRTGDVLRVNGADHLLLEPVRYP